MTKKIRTTISAALLVGTAVLLGCATAARLVQEQPMTARLAVQAAALKVIDEDADRAQRVAAIASTTRAALSTETAATVDALEAIARAQIDWARLEPADALLVELLLAEVTHQLKQRLGPDLLTADSALVVATVLEWIESAARTVSREHASLHLPVDSRGESSANLRHVGVLPAERPVVSARPVFGLMV